MAQEYQNYAPGESQISGIGEPITVGRYVNLMNDVAFKIVFGKPENKDLLIALLSAVIPDLKIKDLTHIDKEKVGGAVGDKRTVFDLLCETADGEEVLIEVQLESQSYFRDRTLYYSAQELLWQHGKGDDDYSLKPIYVVSFLNFVMNHERPNKEKFIWRYRLAEVETGEVMSNALNFTYVEMPKFKKTENELANEEDDFYFCLSRMGSLSEQPAKLGTKVFNKLFDEAEFANMTHDQQRSYIAKMNTERDIRNQIAYGRKVAMAEGLAEGRSRGRAEGRAEGLAEGKAEGARLNAVETARRFKEAGIAVSVIASCTGLSEEEVSAL